MLKKTPTDFPNGVIDIFKLHKVFNLDKSECLKKGEVISKVVIKIIIIYNITNIKSNRTKKSDDK